jgi:hypothetical protein
MGDQEFYMYSGQVQKLPCSVRSYVFNDFNQSQAQKITCGINSAFSEVWWFYPSASSDTVDKYVVYNYQEKVWYYGTLERTAWLDRGIGQYPISASLDGYLYYHEFGSDDGSVNPPSAINSYIESRRRFPGSEYNQVMPSSVIRTATVPVEQFTEQVHLRLRGRSFALKVSSAETGVEWRLGTPRVELRPDGRR